MTPPLIPPRGPKHSYGFVWYIGFLLAVSGAIWLMSHQTTGTIGSEQSSFEAEYSSLASKINELEVRKMLTITDEATKAAIDKQLAVLKPRLAQLEPRHQEEVAKKEAEEAEQVAARKREEEENAKRQAEKAAAEFQKRCEDVRAKRIADLTVNDVELLKTCGVPVRDLPRVP